MCSVGPGELIYVPDGWYHATINLGEAVGVAGQHFYALTDLQKMWHKGNAASSKNGHIAQIRAYEAIVREHESNAAAHYALAHSLFLRNDFPAAMERADNGLKVSPRHSDLWYLRGHSALHLADNIKRGGAPEKSVLELFDIALESYETCEKLNPYHLHSILEHAFALRYKNKTDEADTLKTKADQLKTEMALDASSTSNMHAP